MPHSTKIKSKALRSLYDAYIRDDPERVASLQKEMLSAEVAQNLYDLRQEAGLTEEELAERTGVETAVIADLEAGDYDGDSLEALKIIAAALGKKVEVAYLRSESTGDPQAEIPSQGIGLEIQ
jgi:ribosome-binding protein aMBF1 (putative translation factor)